MQSTANATALSPPAMQMEQAEERFVQRGIRAVAIPALLLVLAILALYNPVLKFKFLQYDDNVYVTENPHVQSGLHWSNVRWAFTTFDAANWHPLTWLSHMLDCRLFGLSPAGHHYVNLLLHALNAVLIFLVLYRLTGRLGRSLLVAALFAVHPLNVGSVAWVAERKNMLCTVFWWLAIAAYAWYVRQPSKQRYAAVFVLFALGLMAKPMVITLPVVLLLLDYWPLQRFGDWKGLRPLIVEKVPLFMLSAGSAVITIIAQRSGGAVRSISHFPLHLRAENALVSYAAYLHKTFWPAKLAIFYPFPATSLPWWQISLSLLVLSLITAFAARRRSRQPYLLAGWLWYLVTLLPVIGLVQVGNQGMADRYAYIPLVGVFIGMVWLAADLLSTQSKNLAFAISGLVLLALAIASRSQLGFYQDTVSVWTRALQVSPASDFAEINLGEALKSDGRISEALPHFAKFVQHHAEVADAHYLYGYDLMLAARPQQAIPELELSLKLTRPTRPDQREQTEQALGEAFFRVGDLSQAESHLQNALQLNATDAQSLLDMGLVLEREGRLEAAIAQFFASLKISPTDLAYLHLGECFEQEGQSQLAASAYQRVLQIAPPQSANAVEARKRLGSLSSFSGSLSK